MNQMDETLLQSVGKLVEIQDQIEKINEEALGKVLEIECRYNELLKPLYDIRTRNIKNIKGFWRTVLIRHPGLRYYINRNVSKIFNHLSSLEVRDFKDDVESGYSLIFNFNSNPYVANTSITKTFTFHDDGTTEITATPVQWNTDAVGGSDIKVSSILPKSGQSFITWFGLSGQKVRTEDFDDEIADTIKKDLWPNLLSYLKIKPEWDEAAIKPDDTLIRSCERVLMDQDDIEKFNKEAMIEVFEVEKWRNEMCKPFYEERNKIIINTIPDFWRIAFLSHPVLTMYIKTGDEEIFEHLTFLEVEGFQDMNPGYSITLNFEWNPYFDNTKLKKTFRFLHEGIEVTATTINWKEGMVPKIDEVKDMNMMPFSDESFFAWFCPSLPKLLVEPLKDEIAESIKDVWANPLLYISQDPGDMPEYVSC